MSGALDPNLLAIANALVGQSARHPAIECFDGGQQWRAEGGRMLVAVAGDATLEIADDDGRRSASPWRAYLLEPGHSLRIVRTGSGRQALLAVAGLEMDAVLGSVSTYARAGLGGWQGRALMAGDDLPVATPASAPIRSLPAPFAYEPGPIRVVLGPQDDYFSTRAIRDFLAQDYTVGTSADRMGIRLEGAPIDHAEGKGHEIVSDAIVPGAIQVPGNGLPIILLADAQTAGGYPKIATVVSADLPRVAASRPGERLRFRAIAPAEGIELARLQATRLAQAIASIRQVAGEGVDLKALYCQNLIGGIVDAMHPDIIPAAAKADPTTTGP
jgi:allophanate hydrolase